MHGHVCKACRTLSLFFSIGKSCCGLLTHEKCWWLPMFEMAGFVSLLMIYNSDNAKLDLCGMLKIAKPVTNCKLHQFIVYHAVSRFVWYNDVSWNATFVSGYVSDFIALGHVRCVDPTSGPQLGSRVMRVPVNGGYHAMTSLMGKQSINPVQTGCLEFEDVWGSLQLAPLKQMFDKSS